MATDTAAIRQFLKDKFSDEELTALSFDYFPEVYQDLSSGMSKGNKIGLLLDYCRRRDQFPALLAVLERERPKQYRAHFSATPQVEPPATQPQTKRNPRQIFLSHAKEDARFAQRLAADLRERGWPVWIAPDNIRPGEKWVEAIERGLEESGILVVSLTPNALKSQWVRSETNIAIGLQHQGEMRFVPLQVEPCEAPLLWRAYQWISFEEEYSTGFAELLSAIEDKKRAPKAATTGLAGELRSEIVREQADSTPHPTTEFGDVVYVRNALELPHDLAVDTIIWEKDGKEIVRVPAGKFLYGDKKEEKDLPEFWIDKTPVTNAEYARFVAAMGHGPPMHWNGKSPPNEISDHPVVHVSWNDAAAYAEWAGKELPTEEEWEKAARGTDGREFPWGNQEPTEELCNFDNNVGTTTPVGRYSPQGDSPYGCVDMSGNVWEWTASLYREDRKWRTLRGGSWDDRGLAPAASRYYDSPNFRNHYSGFRVVARRSPSQ